MLQLTQLLYVLCFLAGGRNYTASVHTLPHSVTTLFGGCPWNYEAHLLVFRCILDVKQGAGTAVFWYRWVGHGIRILVYGISSSNIENRNKLWLKNNNKVNKRSCSCVPNVGMCRHGGIAACTFNLSTRRRCVVSFMPRLLYSWQKISQYPGQHQSGCSGEYKNLLLHLGLKPLFISHLACNIITTLTVFFRTVMCYFSVGCVCSLAYFNL